MRLEYKLHLLVKYLGANKFVTKMMEGCYKIVATKAFHRWKFGWGKWIVNGDLWAGKNIQH